MKSCITAVRTSRLKGLLFALAFLAWNVAPLCAQSNSFGGLVIGLDGAPLAGVVVRAKPEGANAAGLPTIVTQADASGEYRFEAIPSGNYLLSAGIEDGKGTSFRTIVITSIESTFFLNFAGIVESRTNQVKVTPILMGPPRITVPDDTNSPFHLRFAPSTVSLSAQLVIPPGTTLPPMRANLTRTASPIATEPTPDSPATGVLQMTTSPEFSMDADLQPNGALQFPQVPPGNYVLRLNPNMGVPPATITVADQNVTDIALGGKSAGVRVGGYTPRSDLRQFKDQFPQWIYLIAKDATEFQPTARPPISAIAAMTPSAPPRAFLDAAGEEIEAPITPVQPDGRFEFLTVPAGDYYVRTIPDVGIPDTKLHVSGDTDIDNIRLGDGTRVRGEVIATNSGTRPPEVISLISTRPRGQGVSALVDARGAFEFPKIGAGTYRILIDGKVRQTPTEVAVEGDDFIIRVETAFSAWVPGRVVFDGPVPPSESLDVTRVALTNGYGAEIKPDGTFQIKSDEGEYQFFMLSLPEGYTVKSAVSAGVNLLVEPVKVDLRIPTSEILVTLQYKPEPTQ